MLVIYTDGTWTPGTSTSPGRYRAGGGGASGSDPATPPFTVVDASAKDKKGGPYAGRVRIYKGYAGGIRPKNMNLVDALLPNGQDKRCFLTIPDGTGFVYIKLTPDKTTGVYSSAEVIKTTAEQAPDGTNLYRLLATVTTTNGKPVPDQNFSGNWDPATMSSGDGKILYGLG